MLIAGAIVGAAIFKVQVERLSHGVAKKFSQSALERHSTESIAIEIAKLVHEQYRATERLKDTPLLFKLRPYLTHRFLPEFLRIETGAIEALLIEGKCDSAARTTVFILGSVGIRAEQLNLVGRMGGAHSIVQAFNPDGSTFLLDPLYGVAPQHNGDVLSIEETTRLQKSGAGARTVWSTITDGSRFHPLYENFPDLWKNTQGAAVEFEVDVDLGNSERLQIGQIDQSSAEVGDAAAKYGLTRYWQYLGHRFDRGWVRTMKFHQPTIVTFILTDNVRDNVITTTRKPNTVSGNTLQYIVQSGEKLSFHDGRAQINWLKLDSYQDVDAIIFERLR